MIHILIISLFLALQSSIMGFTQSMIYTGKKWRNFKWDEHLIYNIERVLWVLFPLYFMYLGQVFEFKSFVHFIVFGIGFGVASALQYSFWQNGFYNLVQKWTGNFPYKWTSTNDPDNGVYNPNFIMRASYLFLGIALLFPLVNFTTN